MFIPDLYGSQELAPHRAIYTRGDAKQGLPKSFTDKNINQKEIRRAQQSGDVNEILSALGMTQVEFQRAITTTNTAFPSRENLEADAKVLIPLDTPLRNKIPRVVGSGLAAKWKQLISLGGGYAGATTTNANIAAAATTLTVVSAAGFTPGDTLLVDTGAAQEIRIIGSISGTTVTVTVAFTNAHTQPVAVTKYGVQPGSNQTGALQAFFAETGAPAEHTSVYADQIQSYKLMGEIGRVSGFAAAGGANFQNQLATEKTNAILNTMLNEENALINGDATSPLAPWGDGTNPLSYNGLMNLIATANGTPADQVQVNVGPLTLAHIDQQLGRLYRQGAQLPWMLMNEQEIRSLSHLAEASGSIMRIVQDPSGATLGVQIAFYSHPITGEKVPIMPSRYMQPGSIIFGCDRLPKGDAALQVDVLPQVQLPILAPSTNIQGYVAQEIAPSASSPATYPFLVSVYSTLKLKSALHFCVSRNVSAV